MTCRYFSHFSTRPTDVSMLSTSEAALSILGLFLSMFSGVVEAFDKIARLREQLDSQVTESTELETQIKANLEGLGL